jgi:hypothetical protein
MVYTGIGRQRISAAYKLTMECCQARAKQRGFATMAMVTLLGKAKTW